MALTLRDKLVLFLKNFFSDLEYPAAVFPLEIFNGRAPQVSSRFKSANPSRPSHNGDDWLYKRMASDPSGGSPRYFVPEGALAIAIRDGKVLLATKIATGFRAWIEHSDGYRSGYFHLSKLFVRDGQRVLAGTPVGLVGDNPADRYDQRHLHFEISPIDRYKPVDPWRYLQDFGAVPSSSRKEPDVAS